MLIAYASMSGNSEFVAQQVQGRVGGDVVHADDLTVERLKGTERALFVVPSWGDGEVPADAEPLYEALQQAGPGALPALRFALIAPGNRSYADFCGGGKRFAAALAGAGAQPIADPLLVDGAIEPQLDAILAWVDGLAWPALAQP